MIQFTNVTKLFDNRIVLKDISLKIPNGSIVGLVGPNGSGKSTLLRLLSGVYKPTSGIISINEKEVYENISLKETIFFLGDEPFFFPQSTLKDMKEFYQVFYKKFEEALYYELLDQFRISENTKINQFSKGMKRQVSLILALASKPEILLLDEAFDGLDPVLRFKLKQIMGDFINNSESIIIISSHNLSELEDICDSIVMIKDNSLLLNNSVDETRSHYHKISVAFSEEHTLDDFKYLKPLHISGHKRIFTLILKGDLEDIKTSVSALNPILLETTPLSLKEIFIYELEAYNQ